MKKSESVLENFVENSLTKTEKRNIIGSAPEKEKPKPPFREGNPLGSSTNGDGKTGDGTDGLPPIISELP